jgi:protein Mpv17
MLVQAVMPKNPTHPVAVLSKVALDQLINSPVGTACYFAWSQSLQGRPDQIATVCGEKLFDTTRTGWCMWPAAQAANFIFVPLQYRIVFINVVAIAWTCILSKIGNESG